MTELVLAVRRYAWPVRLAIRNRKDFAAGALFIAAGAGFAWLSSDYSIGSASRMGPGYFPFWVAVLLLVLGAAIAFSSLNAAASEQALPEWNLASLLWILGSTSLFGALLNFAGLVASLLALVVLSSKASHEFKWLGTLVSASVIVLINLIVFVWLLKIEIPTWPVFLAN